VVDIVVTGGAGLQGSKLSLFLADSGYHVTVIDNMRRGKLENLRGRELTDIDLHVLDLRYTPVDRLAKTMQGAEAVFHLAAHVGGVEYSHINDRQMLNDNLMSDSNTIAAARQARVKKFVYPSTACAYPVSRQREWNSVLREDQAFDPVEPENGYGWSKLTAELLLSKEDRMEVGILRLFNVYGPGEDDIIGTSHVVPELIKKTLFDPEVVVFGDGTAGRCFLYADDAVEAYLACLEKGLGQGPINVGDPNPVRIGNLAHLIQLVAGVEKKVVFDPSKPEGVKGRVPDIAKARRILGWEPKTSLADGLRPTIEHIKSEATVAAIR
jgi:GDP-D-mannose 3',5'-epimerase